MYKKKKIFCIILARKNSKVLKTKIYEIKKTNHLFGIYKCCKESKYIDEIYFNSDAEKMAKLASKFGANIEFIRPNYLARSIQPLPR